MAAVVVVTSQAAAPLAAVHEGGVCDVEPISWNVEFEMTRFAKVTGGGDADPLVLQVTAVAQVGGSSSSSVGEARLHEPEHRVTVFGSIVARETGAVSDWESSHAGWHSSLAHGKAEVGLQLLAQRSWSTPVAVGAGKGLVPDVHRADSLQVSGHWSCQCGQPGDREGAARDCAVSVASAIVGLAPCS